MSFIRRWKSLLVLGGAFVAIGLYSGISTVASLDSLSRETVTLQSVRERGDGQVELLAQVHGASVRVIASSDSAAEYKVGEQLQAYRQRDGDYVEANGPLGLEVPIILIVVGAAFLAVALLKRSAG